MIVCININFLDHIIYSYFVRSYVAVCLLFACLLVCLLVCLFACLLVCLFVCLFGVYFFACLLVCLFMFVTSQ